MTNFFVYIIGVILVVAGAVGYGAHLVGLGEQWIAVVVLVILGLQARFSGRTTVGRNQ